MEFLAKGLLKKANAIACVAVVIIVTGAFLMAAGELKKDDDILKFLPEGNQDVTLFTEINKRFGSLDVAIVGIEDPAPFKRDFLEKIQQVTRTLNELPSVALALSISNVQDFTQDAEQGGIQLAPLVHHLPESPQDEAALKRKIMSRKHVVGNLVSKNANAVIIYCFAALEADPKTMATEIKRSVEMKFTDNPTYWGGAPFISTYIYETTQRDMDTLTPWAVLAVVLIMLLAFRDFLGSFLALVSTGMGIVVTHGLMGLFDVPFNIVLSSMPIILFAVGSAYGIHILAHYYALEPRIGRDAAITQTLTSIGPTVWAAGLTTVAGLLSFTMMDISPMRSFGLFTAIGIFVTLILSLTFIPAMIRLTSPRRHMSSSHRLAHLTARITAGAQIHRRPVGVALLVLAILGAIFTAHVDTRVDNAAFFSKESPPDLAERFLGEHFGGSQFVQIHVNGDMRSPYVLREIQRIGDALETLPEVTDALTISMAVAEANYAMEGARRIPDTREKVALLYGFMAGNRSTGQLVNENRDEALITLKVSATRAEDVERILQAIETYVADSAISHYRVASADGADAAAVAARKVALTKTRIRALAGEAALSLDPTHIEALDDFLTTTLNGRGPVPSEAIVIASITSYLRSEECVAELPSDAPTLPSRISQKVTALGPHPTREQLIASLVEVTGKPADDMLVDDLDFALETPLKEAWLKASATTQADALSKRLGWGPETVKTDFTQLRDDVAFAMIDLANTDAMLPGPPGDAGHALSFTVNGLPVLHRGLSNSVRDNQLKSLAFALLLVMVIMTLLFRSLWSGIVATAPTLLTLILVYGGMGLLEVHLDIGTSMLASIIIGAGVDYAVHLVSAWEASRDESLEDAARKAAFSTGPAIWTNAIMVAVGFFVLTLGEARPLQNVGGLTAAAMIVAGCVTFLTIPVIARKKRYRRHGLAEA